MPGTLRAALPSPVAVRFAICLLAGLLLVLGLMFHVPMMLWDHLDLVPMLEALQRGQLPVELWQLHGGHLHSAAYVVLLVIASISGGSIWLDTVASWTLLVGFATLVAALARNSGIDSRSRPAAWLLLLGIALFPGHLANLQWGWQVAVFLCLLGTGTTIWCLCRPVLSATVQVLALAAAAIALLSFATAVALLPTALLLIWLRTEFSLRRRLLLSLPWLLLVLLVALQYQGQASQHGASLSAGAPAIGLYVLNFLGGALVRFAEGLAPLVALPALLVGGWFGWLHRGDAAARPWIGFAVFGLLAACAVALGRSGPYGADHAFVTRYVSFSSLFWLGFCGILAGTRAPGPESRRWLRPATVAVTLLLAANGLHMIRQAIQLGGASRDTAAAIRATFPEVPREVLADIYFDQPDAALARLHFLQELGYPPFQPTTNRPAAPHSPRE